jgi:ketosteroid isomerase-like protein
LHSIWIDAVNAGNLARLFTLMTDDVVFLNPGRAPFGRDDVLGFRLARVPVESK